MRQRQPLVNPLVKSKRRNSQRPRDPPYPGANNWFWDSARPLYAEFCIRYQHSTPFTYKYYPLQK